MGAVTFISLLAGLADVVGGGFTMIFGLSKERMDELTAVGAGFLLGGALLGMLPSAITASADGPVYVTLGYLGVMFFRLLSHRGTRRAKEGRPDDEAVFAAMTGLMIHSFVEGAALAAAAQVDQRFGLMALLAMFLHKIPEGFSLSAVMLAAGRSRRSALLGTVLLGLATVVGAWAASLWTEAASLSRGALLGIAAGSFLYVGATDMVPALAGKRRAPWLALLGVALFWLLSAGGHGLHAHTH